MNCINPTFTPDSCISCSGCLISTISTPYIIFTPLAKYQLFSHLDLGISYDFFEGIFSQLYLPTESNEKKDTPNLFDSSFFISTYHDLLYKKIKETLNTVSSLKNDLDSAPNMVRLKNSPSTDSNVAHAEHPNNLMVTSCPYLLKTLNKKYRIIKTHLPKDISKECFKDKATLVVASHERTKLNEITVEEIIELKELKEKILKYLSNYKEDLKDPKEANSPKDITNPSYLNCKINRTIDLYDVESLIESNDPVLKKTYNYSTDLKSFLSLRDKSIKIKQSSKISHTSESDGSGYDVLEIICKKCTVIKNDVVELPSVIGIRDYLEDKIQKIKVEW